MTLFFLGYCCNTTVKKRIQDYDPDYPKETSNVKPCIIVSNHIGIVESSLINKFTQMSFTAKAKIKKIT
jgi:hypothetical protein